MAAVAQPSCTYLGLFSCEFLIFSVSLTSGIPPCTELSAQDKAWYEESQTENRGCLHEHVFMCWDVSTLMAVLVTICSAPTYIPTSLLVLPVLRSIFVFPHKFPSDLRFVQTSVWVSLRKIPVSSLWWQDTSMQNYSECSNSGHLYQVVVVAILTPPLLCPIYNTLPNFLPSFRGYHDSQTSPAASIWDRGKATVTGNKLFHVCHLFFQSDGFFHIFQEGTLESRNC